MSRKKLINVTITVAAIVIAFLMAPFLGNDFWVSMLIMLALNILLASSLRTIFILNEVSLGHVGFTLIGAYTSALLAMKLGLSVWLSMLGGGLLSAFVALILSYPFLRTKAIFFSILTFMTAEIFRLITYGWRDFTGGQDGLPDIPFPEPITLPVIGEISFKSMTNYYYLTLVVVIISLLLLYGLEHSHLSQKWRAIRDADNLALSVGINIMGYKMVNFTIASFFAGIAGALFAHYQRSLNVDLTSRFGIAMSLNLVILMVVGGKARFSGPIIGVIAIELLTEFSRPLGAYRPMLIGFLAIFVILVIPDGIVGIPDTLIKWGKRIKTAKGG